MNFPIKGGGLLPDGRLRPAVSGSLYLDTGDLGVVGESGCGGG